MVNGCWAGNDQMNIYKTPTKAYISRKKQEGKKWKTKTKNENDAWYILAKVQNKGGQLARDCLVYHRLSVIRCSPWIAITSLLHTKAYHLEHYILRVFGLPYRRSRLCGSETAQASCTYPTCNLSLSLPLLPHLSSSAGFRTVFPLS